MKWSELKAGDVLLPRSGFGMVLVLADHGHRLWYPTKGVRPIRQSDWAAFDDEALGEGTTVLRGAETIKQGKPRSEGGRR